MTGGLIASVFNEKLGRKRSLLVSKLTIVFGAVLSYFANRLKITYHSESKKLKIKPFLSISSDHFCEEFSALVYVAFYV